MNEATRERLAEVWDGGVHKIVATVLIFGFGTLFFVILKAVADYDAAKAFALLTFLSGVTVGGVLYLLIDKWLKPGHAFSGKLWVLIILGGLAAFALAGWNASEEWKSRQPRQEPDYREQIRQLERQQRQ